MPATTCMVPITNLRTVWCHIDVHSVLGRCKQNADVCHGDDHKMGIAVGTFDLANGGRQSMWWEHIL